MNENSVKKAKEARATWNKENMKTLGANVKKETAEKFAEIAARRGATPSGMIREFIRETVERESRSGLVDEPYRSPFTVFPENADRLKAAVRRHKGNPDIILNTVLAAWLDADEKLAK